MAQVENLVWPQGDDLTLELIYEEGDTEPTLAVVDLSTGYQFRMDIVNPGTGDVLYTFNSQSIADVDPLTAGDQADSVIEATLTSGAGGTPNITIEIPRSLTLPGGAIYNVMTEPTPVTVLEYDGFLRNTGTNRQKKVVTGSITLEASKTLWL